MRSFFGFLHFFQALGQIVQCALTEIVRVGLRSLPVVVLLNCGIHILFFYGFQEDVGNRGSAGECFDFREHFVQGGPRKELPTEHHR